MAHSPLLLQLIIILGCARILGLILRFFGQPMVIGEMVAGLMLGPAVFGAIAPSLQAALFQHSSLPELDAGLIGKPLFTMLLVMAIVTTVMTGPLLNVFARGQLESSRIARLS